MDELDRLSNKIVECKKCPRLVEWREETARVKRKAYLHEAYWGKPVPGFGDHDGKILIVGLAPGAHGSNRTGRMFTGDASGDFLYPALYKAVFANQPKASTIDDGLLLKDIFITAVCRCVPPDNKPNPDEVKACLPYLQMEFDLLNPKGFVALGKIAWDNVIRLLSKPLAESTQTPLFSHGAFWQADNHSPWVLGSYHPSRQNTQTGRLTMDMFASIWLRAAELINNAQ